MTYIRMVSMTKLDSDSVVCVQNSSDSVVCVQNSSDSVVCVQNSSDSVVCVQNVRLLSDFLFSI